MASKKENRDVRLFIRVTPEELDEIILAYRSRERRFGGRKQEADKA